jgi:SAM-dependent methyltransferase
MTAFDALAPTYDDDFTQTRIGRYLRGRVHRRLLTHFSPGAHLLELGCGTGEDALFLAERGLHIIATDASPAMLDITREKTQHLENVSVQPLDLSQPHLTSHTRFDGVFSNFGALNCLDNRSPLAEWLSRRVQPGGMIAFGVMAPFCIWELLWHGLHGDTETALRRIRGSSFGELTITYPSVKRLTDDFKPYFERVHRMPLGLFLPPSDVFGVVEKRPRLLNFLTHLENLTAGIAPLANFADHYWIEFQRRD